MRKLLEGRKFCAVAGAVMAFLFFDPMISGAERELGIGTPLVRIKRQAVDSTNLASAGYDRDARVLEIEFRSGVIYRYLAVQPEVFENLMSAASKGRFFVREIRGKYQFQRVREIQR